MKIRITGLLLFAAALFTSFTAFAADAPAPDAWDIGKLASDAAPIMVGVLAVGAILKNAFPAFPNRFIPAVTWVLGVVGFLLKSGDHSGKGIFLAVLVSAAATGLHSGLKNSFQSRDEPPPTPPEK